MVHRLLGDALQHHRTPILISVTGFTPEALKAPHSLGVATYLLRSGNLHTLGLGRREPGAPGTGRRSIAAMLRHALPEFSSRYMEFRAPRLRRIEVSWEIVGGNRLAMLLLTRLSGTRVRALRSKIETASASGDERSARRLRSKLDRLQAYRATGRYDDVDQLVSSLETGSAASADPSRRSSSRSATVTLSLSEATDQPFS